MADYLLIRGGSGERVLDALAVAADLTENSNIQVDVAVPATLAPVAQLSEAVRRVVPISAPTPLKITESVSKGNWKNKLLAATKTVASTANRNMRSYLAVAEELRLVHYDAVFDFDASGFSLATARAAKTRQIIGFSSKCLPNAVPGAVLMYHDTRLVPQNLNETARCRHLAARFLNYPPDLPITWKLRTIMPPSWMPKTPFVFAGGNIPAPFIAVLTAAGLAVVGDLQKADIHPPEELSPATLTAMATAATAVVGNGLLTAVAAATGAQTLFIGAPKALPHRSTLIETPAALKKALEKCTAPFIQSPPTNAPPKIPPNSTSGNGLRLKK